MEERTLYRGMRGVVVPEGKALTADSVVEAVLRQKTLVGGGLMDSGVGRHWTTDRSVAERFTHGAEPRAVPGLLDGPRGTKVEDTYYSGPRGTAVSVIFEAITDAEHDPYAANLGVLVPEEQEVTITPGTPVRLVSVSIYQGGRWNRHELRRTVVASGDLASIVRRLESEGRIVAPIIAQDGDCIVVSHQVTQALNDLGLDAKTVTVWGWMDRSAKLLGFVHQATLVGDTIVDLTATQFDRSLPAVWVAEGSKYLRAMAEATGVQEVTLGSPVTGSRTTAVLMGIPVTDVLWDSKGSTGFIREGRPVLAYRGFGSWDEMKDAIRQGGWKSKGNFNVSGEGDTQVAFSLQDVLDGSGFHRLRGTGFLAIAEIDISGLEFETHLKPDSDPTKVYPSGPGRLYVNEDNGAGMVYPDLGLGIGIVGKIPLDRIKTIHEVSDGRVVRAWPFSQWESHIDRVVDNPEWSPNKKEVVSYPSGTKGLVHRLDDGQVAFLCGAPRDRLDRSKALIDPVDLSARPDRVRNFWGGKTFSVSDRQVCPECFHYVDGKVATKWTTVDEAAVRSLVGLPAEWSLPPGWSVQEDEEGEVRLTQPGTNSYGPTMTQAEAIAKGWSGPYYHGTTIENAKNIRQRGFREPRYPSWQLLGFGNVEELVKSESLWVWATDTPNNGYGDGEVMVYFRPGHFRPQSGLFSGEPAFVADSCADAAAITDYRQAAKTSAYPKKPHWRGIMLELSKEVGQRFIDALNSGQERDAAEIAIRWAESPQGGYNDGTGVGVWWSSDRSQIDRGYGAGGNLYFKDGSWAFDRGKSRLGMIIQTELAHDEMDSHNSVPSGSKVDVVGLEVCVYPEPWGGNYRWVSLPCKMMTVTAATEPTFQSGGDQNGPQYDGWVAAFVGGEYAGHFDWSIERSEPDVLAVRMIEVEPEYRGRGLAMAMIDRVVREQYTDWNRPEPTIHGGMLTDDGAKLWPAVRRRYKTAASKNDVDLVVKALSDHFGIEPPKVWAYGFGSDTCDGIYSPEDRSISIHRVQEQDGDRLLDTIAHEFAHYLDDLGGGEVDHGQRWKDLYRQCLHATGVDHADQRYACVTKSAAWAPKDVDEGTPSRSEYDTTTRKGDHWFYQREQDLYDAGMPKGQVFDDVGQAQRYTNDVLRSEGITEPCQIIFSKERNGVSGAQWSRDMSQARIVLDLGHQVESYLLHELAHIVYRKKGSRKGPSHASGFSAVYARLLWERMGVSLSLGSFGRMIERKAVSVG